jgi:hypothetical protein
MAHGHLNIAAKVNAEVNKINNDISNLVGLLNDAGAREGLSTCLFDNMVKRVNVLEKQLRDTYYDVQITYTDPTSETVYYLTYDDVNQDIYLQTSDTSSDYTQYSMVSTVVSSTQNNITLTSNVNPYPYIAIDSSNSTIYTTTSPANTFGYADFRQSTVSGTSNYSVRGLATGWTTEAWIPASVPPSVGTLLTLGTLQSPVPTDEQFQFIIPPQKKR